MDKQRRSKLANALAALFVALFIGACLLLSRCPSPSSDVTDFTKTISRDTMVENHKTIVNSPHKKPKKEKHNVRPKERNFRDESVPSSL